MTLHVDQEQLVHEIEVLSGFSATLAPEVTRVVFSEPDRRARAWFKGLCLKTGLHVREDAVGNTFARWTGSAPDLPAIGSGSHIDAIPHSGRYDGTVGVLGALEAIRTLQRACFQPRRSIELLLFTSEEPTRFGIGCLGSRLLSGTLEPARAAALRDSEGASLDELRTAAGFSGPLDSVALPRDYYHAFVELHIEQGPLLEREGIPLGIVRAIAAPATLRFEFEGEGGHAGAVLMPDRRDAFLAAAETALAVESAAKATGAIDTVGTVGLCDIFPGVVNGIASRVRMLADVRDIDQARRDCVLAEIQARAHALADARRVGLRIEVLNADAPTQCSAQVVDALRASAEDASLPYRMMVSRAYHDSLFMAQVAPVGMLFIPCRAGVSHRPDEYAAPDDMGRGIRVLAATLAKLAG
jgi:N-carbamoyl-L-amino-acid hydrolase